MLAASSSIQHEPVFTYDGTYFQTGFANDSTYFKPALDDLPTTPTDLSGNQYQLLPNANYTTKSTKPVSDVPKHEYTYNGENHSHSEGDYSNQRHFLFINYILPILKKKHRRRKKSRKPGTRKKEVTTKQDQSSNEKGTEQHNSREQTPTGNDSQVHSPVMEESVQLSISGGNSDVMVTPSQNPKAQADKDKDESSSEEIWPWVDSVEVVNTCASGGNKLVILKLQTANKNKDESSSEESNSEESEESDSEEPDIEPWVDPVEAGNTYAVDLDQFVIPKLLTVVGTHVFNGSVITENNVATEDTCMGSVIKPFVELGPPPEKELCNYCTHWYANAVPTA